MQVTRIDHTDLKLLMGVHDCAIHLLKGEIKLFLKHYEGLQEDQIKIFATTVHKSDKDFQMDEIFPTTWPEYISAISGPVDVTAKVEIGYTYDNMTHLWVTEGLLHPVGSPKKYERVKVAYNIFSTGSKHVNCIVDIDDMGSRIIRNQFPLTLDEDKQSDSK